jgi:hypothetical protein
MLVRRDVAIRIVIAAVGFAPVTALAAAIFLGEESLATTVLALVLPAAAVLAELLWLKPNYRTIAISGFAFGLVAVTVYDLFRLPFMLAGVWPDFIPRIGFWLTGDASAPPVLGYLYRYIGDGGGMGMGFVAIYPILHRLVPKPFLAGVLYGVGIWCGLIATLIFAPRAHVMLFPLTPLTFTLSLSGHLVYGAVLGLLIGSQRARSLTHAGEPQAVPALS